MQKWVMDSTGVAVVKRLRNRFFPLTEFCGPLTAGQYTGSEGSESLYLDMQGRWLGTWAAALLSDEEVAQLFSVADLTKQLLRSASAYLIKLTVHVEKIEESEENTEELLRHYLDNPGDIVVDGIACRRLHIARQRREVGDVDYGTCVN